MIDFHCHLDLYKNPISLLPDVKKRCRFVLAVTTSPRAFVKTSQVFSGIDCISIALGLHPEILADRIIEREQFLSLIPHTQYIGEVGIDGSARNRGSLDLQVDFFNEAIKTAEKYGGRIISIHSRKATKSALSIIEKTIRTCVPIMHWFSGTDKELDWAISMNCWFSVNPLMLSNRKGISLVQKVPLSKLVPETDGPFATHNGIPYMPWDTNAVVENIAKYKGLPIGTVLKAMGENLDGLCVGTR